ncbi:MAG: outer membrane protein assembly factor BamE [Betaproteobacteria bacterium]
MRRSLAPAATAALVVASALLAGCGSLDRTDGLLGAITPYRIDIVQGNVVTKEQLAVVRPGLTRLQVRDVLGSPLLTDPFHADRWDYLFTLRRPGAELQRRSVVVFFDGDRVKSVEAPNDLPTEREVVASISRNQKITPVKLELTEDERKALPPPARLPALPAEPAPQGPARAYPPLEPG